MPILDLGADFVPGATATAASVNARFDAMEEFMNVTKLDGDNIQDGSITSNLLAPGAVTAAAIGIIPAAHVYHGSNQNAGGFSEVTLAFNSERYDTDTMHNTVTNNSRLTCKTAGLFLVHAQAYIDPTLTSSQTYIKLRVNGTTDIANTQIKHNDTGEGVGGIQVTTPWVFAVNDYVEVRFFHSQSTGAVLVQSSFSPEFSMTFMGKVA